MQESEVEMGRRNIGTRIILSHAWPDVAGLYVYYARAVLCACFSNRFFSRLSSKSSCPHNLFFFSFPFHYSARKELVFQSIHISFFKTLENSIKTWSIPPDLDKFNVKSYIRWRGEWNISVWRFLPNKCILKLELERESQRKQYLLVVSLSGYKWY